MTDRNTLPCKDILFIQQTNSKNLIKNISIALDEINILSFSIQDSISKS